MADVPVGKVEITLAAFNVWLFKWRSDLVVRYSLRVEIFART
jgi:hypothetical protein